nr:MFS transporter [uncultured Holophaga sp.]
MPDIAYPKFRWFVFAALIVATIGQGVSLIWPAPLMEQLALSLHAPLGVTTGAIMVSFSIFVSIGAVLGGISCDRLGITPTLITSSALVAAGMLLTPVLGHSLQGMLLTRIISGLGAGPVTISIGSIAAVWFPYHQRGPITGLQGMCVALGISLGFACSPMSFLSTHSVQTTGAWLSIFPLAGLAAFALVAFGPRPPAFASDMHSISTASPHDFARAARLPVFYLGILAIFCMSWAFNAINDLTPVYLSAQPPLGAGHGILVAGKFMGLVQLSMMAGSALSGFILSRFFRGHVKAACMLAFAVMALSVFGLKTGAVTSKLRALPLFLFLVGFFEGWIIPNCITFVSMNFPGSIVGKTVGIWMGVGMMGGTAGVVVGAALLHHTGLYQASLTTIGIVCLAGLLCSSLLKVPSLTQVQSPATLPGD